jgi:hypothetical protein
VFNKILKPVSSYHIFYYLQRLIFFAQIVLLYCSTVTIEDFNSWAAVYAECKLGDLKNVANWRFSPEVIDKFFGGILLNGNYDNCYYSRYYTDDELNITPIEHNYLCKNNFAVTKDLQNRPARGLETVIANISKKHDNDDGNLGRFELSEISDIDKTGIWFHTTVELLAEEIIAKCEIGATFRICIVGIHCVVSMCRLILHFEHISFATNFTFTIMDYSEEKINDLRNMIVQSCQPGMRTVVKYKSINFLFAHNHSFQKYNIVLCFLNQSITRIFALKFILLQCYCFPNNSGGLQKILCSQRVSVLIYINNFVCSNCFV